VKVIEVRVREQDEIDGRQILDAQAGAFDAFEEKNPIGEIRINENIQVRELHEERRVADPSERDLPVIKFGENGPLMLAGSRGEKRLPNHLAEKGARIESPRWR
jgi:hypothetical protein